MYSDTFLYKDTYVVINMMSKEMKEKINPKFIKFLEENQDKEYESYLNNKIPLERQKIRPELKLMLSIIYIQYLCDSETKERILLKEKENIKRYNEQITENIFNKKEEKNINNSNINTENNTELVIYSPKERILKKIWNKIKKILKR